MVVSAAWNEAEWDHSSQKLCFLPVGPPDEGLGLRSSDGPTGFCGIGGGGHVGISQRTGDVLKLRTATTRGSSGPKEPVVPLRADARAIRAPETARLSFMMAALYKDAHPERGEFIAWHRMTLRGGEVGGDGPWLASRKRGCGYMQ